MCKTLDGIILLAIRVLLYYEMHWNLAHLRDFLMPAAVHLDGSVYTWGAGGSGQLGHGSTDESAVPKVVRFVEEYEKFVQVYFSHSSFSCEEC